MADVQRISPRDRRITKHIAAIGQAGSDLEAFAAAVRSVRDDPSLTSAHRDAIFKTLAQDAAQAFFVFATGKALDMEELLGEAPPEPPKRPGT
ncbi:MAG: hypothetical protein KC933_15735 [Myxococcales bacterium]|nr:hypothetical protein [Myxococcales bacterium]